MSDDKNVAEAQVPAAGTDETEESAEPAGANPEAETESSTKSGEEALVADKSVAVPPALIEQPNSGEAPGPSSGEADPDKSVFTPLEPSGQAGNVADAGGAGAGEAAANIADSLRDPAEGSAELNVPDDRDLFGGADNQIDISGLKRVGGPRTAGDVPDFAREQDDFIPDTVPEDLFMATRDDRALSFFSLLGSSDLPPGEVREYLNRYQSSPDMDLPSGFARVVVPNGSITGSTETKQFHIEGGVVIYYSDIILSADKADIDEKNEMAVLYGNVNIVDPKYTLQANELRIFFEDKRFQAIDFVQFNKIREGGKSEPNLELEKKDRLREYFAGQQFGMYCNELYYNWDTKEMAALDSVRLVHPIFNGTMERIDYNDETKEYEISGRVVFDVTGYDWIFENQLVAEADIDQVSAITDAETKITCDRVVYSEANGIAQFYALPSKQVLFDQDVRRVRANYIEVNDDTKDFFAEGIDDLVEFHQTDGEWLFAGGIIDAAGSSDDLQETLEESLTAHSDTLVYNFDRKHLALLGQVEMLAGDPSSLKTIRADEMVHDETAKFFLLRGNVMIKPDAESEIYAAQVYLDTENDVFTFVGLVQGKLESDQLPSSEDGTAGGGGDVEIAQGLFDQTDVPGVTSGTNAVGRRSGSSNVAEGE